MFVSVNKVFPQQSKKPGLRKKFGEPPNRLTGHTAKKTNHNSNSRGSHASEKPARYRKAAKILAAHAGSRVPKKHVIRGRSKTNVTTKTKPSKRSVKGRADASKQSKKQELQKQKQTKTKLSKKYSKHRHKVNTPALQRKIPIPAASEHSSTRKRKAWTADTHTRTLLAVQTALDHSDLENNIHDQEQLFDNLIDSFSPTRNISPNHRYSTIPRVSQYQPNPVGKMRHRKLPQRAARSAWSHASAEDNAREQEQLFDDLIGELDHDGDLASERKWSPEGNPKHRNHTSPLGSTASRDISYTSDVRRRRAPSQRLSGDAWSYASAEDNVRDQEQLFDDLIGELDHGRHLASERKWSPEANDHRNEHDTSMGKLYTESSDDRLSSKYSSKRLQVRDLEF